MSGFGEGVDQYFAEIVLEKQKENPALELIAVIPYRKRLDSLNEKGRTYKMLEACAEVIVVQEKYHPSVYSRRSRYMAERSTGWLRCMTDGRKAVRCGQSALRICWKKSFVRSRWGKSICRVIRNIEEIRIKKIMMLSDTLTFRWVFSFTLKGGLQSD